MAEPSDFERLGGEPVLRRVIDTFVDRCFDDMMIGFHFRAADRERVKRFEYQHADFGIFRQAVSQHAARRARTGDDVVIVRHAVLSEVPSCAALI